MILYPFFHGQIFVFVFFVHACEQHGGVLMLLVALKMELPIGTHSIVVPKYDYVCKCKNIAILFLHRSSAPLHDVLPPRGRKFLLCTAGHLEHLPCLVVVPKGKEEEHHTHRRYDSLLIPIGMIHGYQRVIVDDH